MTTDPTPDPAIIDPLQMFDVDDVAALLKVSRTWVEQQVARERIPFRRLPGDRMIRFTRGDVEELQSACKQAAGRMPATRQLAALASQATTRKRRGAA